MADAGIEYQASVHEKKKTLTLDREKKETNEMS